MDELVAWLWRCFVSIVLLAMSLALNDILGLVRSIHEIMKGAGT